MDQHGKTDGQPTRKGIERVEGDEIIRNIESFVETGEGNAIPECGGMRICESPLVGFASAEDPMYSELQPEGVIGPHHRTPRNRVRGARTVIAYFLPFTREVVKANDRDAMSSTEWYLSRHQRKTT